MHVCKFKVNYNKNNNDNDEQSSQNNGNSKMSNEPVQTPLLIESVKPTLDTRNSINSKGNRKMTCSIVRLHAPHKNHKQTTIMLFIMMILFFVCILPFRIFSIWAVHAHKEDFDYLGIENYYNILTVSRIMFYINSALNPILYHILSTKFQTAFKRCLCCWISSTRHSFKI